MENDDRIVPGVDDNLNEMPIKATARKEKNTIVMRDGNGNFQELYDHNTSPTAHSNEFNKKVDKITLENANMFKDVNYNNVNGVLTFTRYYDTTKEIDLPLELLVESGYYDEVANELVLVLANGSEIRIPVENLLTDLDAHNIRFNGSGTNYLVGESEVEGAIKELDTRVKADADRIDSVEEDIDELDSRIDTILTTPADSVSAEEIIDARQGEVTLGANITKVKSQLAKNETNIRVTQSNPTNYSGAVATFIDDDNSKYIEDIWLPIIEEKGIEMGFAIITGVMSGDVSPIPQYDPISLEILKELYDNGHDVYSHSFSHLSFYETTTTLDDIENECLLSQKWMNENGFGRNADIIVYPGGLGQGKVDKKNVIRKYYKYGIDATSWTNPNVVDNWRIHRLNADTMTLEELKAKVDEAVEKNSWIVFMNHAYELNKDKTNQMNKIKSLIDYIRSLNVPIMKFSEALKYKGNAVALGEYTDDGLFINVKGEYQKGKNIEVVTAGSSFHMDDSITQYKHSCLTITTIPATQDIFMNRGGVLQTFRTEDISYSYQMFKPINRNELYIRRWNWNSTSWDTWGKANDVVVSYLVPPEWGPEMDLPIDSFGIRTTTVKQIQWQQDTLLGSAGGGTLITYRLADDFYSYQLFHHYDTDRIYKRRWDKIGGVWKAWKKISAGDTVTTAQRNAMVAEALTIGEQVFDSTLGKPLWVKSLSPIVWVDATGNPV